jgi:hypothetical protein
MIGCAFLCGTVVLLKPEIAIGLAFLFMRCVDCVFGRTGVMNLKAKKVVVYLTVFLVVIVNLVSQAVVYICMQHSAKAVMYTGYFTLIELVLWDVLLMPCFMLIGWSLSDKFTKYFNAL